MKPQYANGDRPVVEMPLKGIPAASLESQLQKKARPRFHASAFLQPIVSTSILRLRHSFTRALLAAQVAKDVQIEEGSSKVSGTVYFAGDELRALLSNTYAAFLHTNPLHGDVFPSIRRMEAEVVTMVAAMLGGECAS
jgi:glutamate/tyrosine decarboxylase-like PLP-dependent enzyme